MVADNLHVDRLVLQRVVPVELGDDHGEQNDEAGALHEYPVDSLELGQEVNLFAFEATEFRHRQAEEARAIPHDESVGPKLVPEGRRLRLLREPLRGADFLNLLLLGIGRGHFHFSLFTTLAIL